MQKLYFRTISPVSVTTGEKFSPYSDFVFEGEYVYFLNHEKIKEAFKQKGNMDSLIDEYVAGVATGMDNNRSNFELKNFIKNRLQADFKTLALRVVPKTNSVSGKVLINEIIKSPHFQPYLPGSSLKGAFKGALLYDWLKNHQEGKNQIKELLQNLQDKNKAKSCIEKIEEKYKKIKLAFADSSLAPKEAVWVYKSVRFHLKNPQKQAGIPQYWEAISPDTLLETHFKSSHDIKEIFRCLAQFSRDANQRDIEIIEKFYNQNSQKLLDSYEYLKEELQKGKTCFKLGSGKGYFYQSIGLAVYHYDKAKFNNFLQHFKPANRVSKNASEFPITKTIEVDSIMPWGWLQVDDKEIPKENPTKFVNTEIEPGALQQEEKPKEIVAEYLKAGTKIKQNTEINAIVVKSGKPNKVKLMIAEGNEPEFELKGYTSELAEGTILICKVSQINKKGVITQVSFVNFKK